MTRASATSAAGSPSATSKRKLSQLSTSQASVAYKGMAYDFTYNAAQKYFLSHGETAEVDYQPKQSLREVFECVSTGKADYGIVPLESSSFGSINGVLERLLGSDGQLVIVGEVGVIEYLPLCVRNKGTKLEDIDEIVSHPHILECCGDFLDQLDTKRLALQRQRVIRTATWDTSAAAETVSGQSPSTTAIQAAICSREASDHFKLHVLEESVASFKNAETRYLIIAKSDKGHAIDPIDVQSPKHGLTQKSAALTNAPMKSTIALALRNIPGAIFKMSSCFAFRNIDINKIESRPSTRAMHVHNSHASENDRPFTQRHWDLVFFIDFEPSADEAVNQALRSNLLEYAEWIRDLGTYRSGLQGAEAEPSNWSTMVDLVSY